MAKKKSKAPLIPAPTKEVKVIPKDLESQWGAVQACATAVNIYDKGMYPHQFMGAVRASREFVVKLHEQMVEEAMKHPQAHMISELKELMKERKAKPALASAESAEVAQDGQAN